MSRETVTREAVRSDALRSEALHILQTLRDNGRQGRSNRLGDVMAELGPGVSLELDCYVLFLRRFNYICMDREAQLRLTDAGEDVLGGEALERFGAELAEAFADLLAPGGSLLARPQETEEPPTGSSPFTASPPPAVSASGGRGAELDGRYLVLEPLGTGPFGAVHRGRHLPLGVGVAVKELEPVFGLFSFLPRAELVRRLRRELGAQAQLRHPAVVPVLDLSLEGPRPFVVTELLPTSLRARLDAEGGEGLDPDVAARLFLQLAYGLRAAHAASLTHHNLKPENVLLDAAGNARLGDFGLPRVLEVEPARGLPQLFVGTGGLPYLAPELLARARDAGPGADVYGLGVLLYELLTGQVPGRRSPLPSQVNPAVPAVLDPLFDRMTQDRRDARLPDMDAVLEAFYAAFPGGEHLRKGELVLLAG